MKVQCGLCQHEKNGFCQKKTRNGQPTRIRVNKRRNCDVYKEDPMRVFAEYKKKEAHKAVLKRQELIKAQLEGARQKFIEEAQQGGKSDD